MRAWVAFGQQGWLRQQGWPEGQHGGKGRECREEAGESEEERVAAMETPL
jgi:hypothetical protein